jgi:hypothetical protein
LQAAGGALEERSAVLAAAVEVPAAFLAVLGKFFQ